jgi:hypothetical protein
MVTPMKKSLLRTPRLSAALAGLATAGALLLSGCAAMQTTASDPGSFNAPGSISGNLHGGNQPISGATIKLYATGSAGYGSAGTLLATTTSASDGFGSFQFSQVVSGGTGPGGNSYSCPTPGSLLYLIANGGNTGGGSPNGASTLLVGIGPCSTASSAVINMNEITTAASVYALAPYINPGTTPGTESIGTANTTQAKLGLSNAFANLANIAYMPSGNVANPQLYNGTGTAAGITVTATADATKIVTIADVLASCVGTSGASSAACTDLFNNATPPASATTTSEPTATFATAQDTAQAAYYMAVNAGSNGTFTSCINGATTKAGCLFGLISGTPPFQTPLATAPTDWTIGVTYTATGTCSSGGSFISGAYHGSVDASGNLWFIGSGASSSNLSEISATGQPLFCGGNLSSGRGLTIDANGNVWGSFNGVTTGGVLEVPSGSSSTVAWTVQTAVNPYTMTSDGFGNVFINTSGNGGKVWEWINPGTTTTAFAPTLLNSTGLYGNGAVNLGYVQTDSRGRIWDETSTAPLLFELYPTATAQATITGVAIVGGTVTFTGVNSFTTGQTVQLSGLTSTAGSQFNFQTLTLTAATAGSFSAATAAGNATGVETAGLATVPATYTAASYPSPNFNYGLAIDANNYFYTGTTCCGGTGDEALVKWTPDATPGTTTYTASSTNFGGINGVRSATVDGASNVWLGMEYPNSSDGTLTTGTYSVLEMASSGSDDSATFTTLSPPGVAPGTCTTAAGCPTQGGYFNANFAAPYDMEVDPSGNLWVLNTYLYNATATPGSSLTELIGAAVPVVTPLSIAVRNGQLGTKP